MATFAETLRRLMKEKGITHKALSSTVGVHRTTITDYVNSRRLPPEEVFHRIHQVLPDKELYDAYFAETRPKDRKNKPLISADNSVYNYYAAKQENLDEINRNLDLILKKYGEKVAEKQDKDEYYIAHALMYLVNFMQHENLNKLFPTDYIRYVKLLEKYNKYI